MRVLKYFILVVLFSSCEKADPGSISAPKGSGPDSLQVIWYKLISGKKDTLVRKCLKPLIFDKDVITTDYDLFSNELEVISSFNKMDGNLNWRWDDYYNRGRGNSGYYDGGVKPDDAGVLYWSGVRSYYSIDLKTGKSVRRLDTEINASLSGSQNPRFDVNEGLFLNSFSFPGAPYPEMSVQYVFNSEFEIIGKFSIMEDDGWYPNIVQPRSHIIEDDTLIICPVDWLNKETADIERSSIYCFSMKHDTIKWGITGIERNISINATISGDRYYFVAGSDFYCVDILTGRLIWKRSLNLPLPFRFIDPLTIVDGKIFTRNSLGDAYCLNATNGLVIWANTMDSETGASGFAEGARMEYYKGRLYYSDNTMYVLDALSGRLIKKYKVPRSVPQYYENYIQGITIDPETDRMYFTDGYHLICTKIPE